MARYTLQRDTVERCFRVGPDGKPSAVWSAQQAEIFAICLDSHGVLFAATSPNGGLFRIEDGQAQEVWHSPAKYLWSLQPVADGAIFIGTGEGGRIYRYDGKSQTTVYYETGQTNITSLAAGPAGHLYAGSDPNGLLYDITGPGRANVLYDSSLPEIRAITVAADGTVYVAAMGGRRRDKIGCCRASLDGCIAARCRNHSDCNHGHYCPRKRQ